MADNVNTSEQSRTKKILIADDSLVVLKALRWKLEGCGYAVVTAEDATEAFAAMRRHRIHLLLLDIGFPPDISLGGNEQWDGFGIIDWMQRNDVAKSIPVIIITGSEPEKYRERAAAYGVMAVFKKPVDYAEFFGVIEQVLSGAKKEMTLHG